jgi:hypothetical protein
MAITRIVGSKWFGVVTVGVLRHLLLSGLAATVARLTERGWERAFGVRNIFSMLAAKSSGERKQCPRHYTATPKS